MRFTVRDEKMFMVEEMFMVEDEVRKKIPNVQQSTNCFIVTPTPQTPISVSSLSSSHSSFSVLMRQHFEERGETKVERER